MMANTTITTAFTAAAAFNATMASAQQGVAGNLLQGNTLWLGGAIAALFLINFLTTPKMDPREPPLLKPRIPLIGHIIDLLTMQNGFHKYLYDQEPKSVVCLQMLWGKVYGIWDGTLAQAILKSSHISFDPFVLELSQSMCGYSNATSVKIVEGDLLVKVSAGIKDGMAPKNLHLMNMKALQVIGDQLNEIQTAEHDSLYDWVKVLVLEATMGAIYGDCDPFKGRPDIIEAVWTFEERIPDLAIRPFPAIFARTAYTARAKVSGVLIPYYTAMTDCTDPSVSALVRNRARILRESGVTNKEIGQIEVVLPFVSLTNTAPSLFWMIRNIFSNSDTVERLRQEVEPHITLTTDADSGRRKTAVLDFRKLESDSPLLVSCYQETLRHHSFAVGIRRVMKDLTITDTEGRAFLLKKGIDVQMAHGISHNKPGVWGEDVDSFNPDRFLGVFKPSTQVNLTDEQRKAKKTNFVPFGGGKHLCPGRAFAFAEIASIAVILVTGFEVEAKGMAFGEMKNGPASLANATTKPVNEGKGLGIKIRRKVGWEDVKWEFQ